MNRQAAFAGSFYPASKHQLLEQLASFGAIEGLPRPAFGVIAPHAGYVYSGAIAQQTYNEVEVPPTVVLLGPDHVGRAGIADLHASGAWQTPLGDVPVNESLCQALLEASPLFSENTQAHEKEHSLEVHLPFLQQRQSRLNIVPIMIGRGHFSDLQEVGQTLEATLAQWPEPVLLVASTDMSHFLTADKAEEVDTMALEPVLSLDAERLVATVRNHRISMCGVAPVAVLLAAAQQRSGCDVELIRYGHSGLVNGDNSRVVGYAGLVVR